MIKTNRAFWYSTMKKRLNSWNCHGRIERAQHRPAVVLDTAVAALAGEVVRESNTPHA